MNFTLSNIFFPIFHLFNVFVLPSWQHITSKFLLLHFSLFKSFYSLASFFSLLYFIIPGSTLSFWKVSFSIIVFVLSFSLNCLCFLRVIFFCLFCFFQCTTASTSWIMLEFSFFVVVCFFFLFGGFPTSVLAFSVMLRHILFIHFSSFKILSIFLICCHHVSRSLYLWSYTILSLYCNFHCCFLEVAERHPCLWSTKFNWKPVLLFKGVSKRYQKILFTDKKNAFSVRSYSAHQQ